jgi:predicted RNA binding protein YcfA (HicA-like mRNA interferase family)
MNKIPALKPKDLVRILRAAGFHEDHRSGSHVIMHSDSDGSRVSIPYHRKDLPKGTIQAILRAAELRREAVIDLLYA